MNIRSSPIPHRHQQMAAPMCDVTATSHLIGLREQPRLRVEILRNLISKGKYLVQSLFSYRTAGCAGSSAYRRNASRKLRLTKYS